MWNSPALTLTSPCSPWFYSIQSLVSYKASRNLKSGGGLELSSGKLWILSRWLHTIDVWRIPTGNEKALSMIIHWHATVPPQHDHSVQCALEKQDEAKLSKNARPIHENALNSKYQLQNTWLNKNALGYRSGRNYNSVIIYSPLYAIPNPYVFFFFSMKQKIF